MRGSSVQNQNKNNFQKSETNTEWSKSRLLIQAKGLRYLLTNGFRDTGY